jgi:predicted RNase H-like nuclease (RuvC/YqgF family)
METEIFVNAINMLQKEDKQYKKEKKEKQQQQPDKYARNLTEQISTTNTENEIKDLQNNAKKNKTEIQELQNSVKELNNKIQNLEFGIKQFIEMLSTPSYEEDDEDIDEYEGEDTCDL